MIETKHGHTLEYHEWEYRIDGYSAYELALLHKKEPFTLAALELVSIYQQRVQTQAQIITRLETELAECRTRIKNQRTELDRLYIEKVMVCPKCEPSIPNQIQCKVDL